MRKLGAFERDQILVLSLQVAVPLWIAKHRERQSSFLLQRARLRRNSEREGRRDSVQVEEEKEG